MQGPCRSNSEVGTEEGKRHMPIICEIQLHVLCRKDVDFCLHKISLITGRVDEMTRASGCTVNDGDKIQEENFGIGEKPRYFLPI
jgi:hypothetical protein